MTRRATTTIRPVYTDRLHELRAQADRFRAGIEPARQDLDRLRAIIPPRYERNIGETRALQAAEDRLQRAERAYANAARLVAEAESLWADQTEPTEATVTLCSEYQSDWQGHRNRGRSPP